MKIIIQTNYHYLFPILRAGIFFNQIGNDRMTTYSISPYEFSFVFSTLAIDGKIFKTTGKVIKIEFLIFLPMRSHTQNYLHVLIVKRFCQTSRLIIGNISVIYSYTKPEESSSCGKSISLNSRLPFWFQSFKYALIETNGIGWFLLIYELFEYLPILCRCSLY